MQVTTFTPLAGDAFTIEIDDKAFAATLARYKELHPLDKRRFEDMSSDIQHAIIRASRGIE